MATQSVAQHSDTVRALLRTLIGRTERMPLDRALGRRPAVDIVTPIALPPFDNSQMDGYALRSADLAEADARPATLAVGETIAAGDSGATPLSPGTAAPIMTGAPVPPGADAVVPIEAANPHWFITERPATVTFSAPVPPGRFVRRRGEDVKAGQLLVSAGEKLHARHIGLLAGAGVSEVPVNYSPRILLLSTGAELREPGEPLRPGQIYDANTAMLRAAMTEEGATVRTVRIESDSVTEFSALVRSELSRDMPVDLVVTSGGVSAGAFEVVKESLTAHGVEFVTVAMQPGGPQGSGTVFGIPVLTFPGNPVSAYISFEVFLRPVLRRALGAPDRTALPADLAQDIESPEHKHQMRRATLRDEPGGRVAELESGPGSHLLGALARSNALVHIPVGTSRLPAGAKVEAWQLGPLAAGAPREQANVPDLPHLNNQGEAHMVDVSGKTATARRATAKSVMRTRSDVVEALVASNLKKGDALGVARIAGILAAKRTSELVPLCHPLPLTSITVEFEPELDSVTVTSTVSTTAVTGVEMEALTAVSVAALTLYDMIKSLDPAAQIEHTAVWRKTGGKAGDWVRP
ncbi:MAG TPA: gephyrin-like molybdotransferase Glp [Mycobacteriales bacterium]|jgi:molybdopterin molybdotransferase|nr:gephyrin-like molybdotransferase Glp [Mycobacteriales bacterium]